MDILNKQDTSALDLQKPVAQAVEEELFDIGSIDIIKDANAGTGIDLHHPITGRRLKIKIYVLGRDSDKFKAIQAAQAQARLAKASKGGFRASNVDPKEHEEDGISLLAACTLGWDNLVLNGREVPFSESNAEVIYAKHPWIKEQVDVAIADRALFTKV